MPHHKSNFKRMKQSEKQRTRNRAWRSQLRAAIRDMRASVGAEDYSARYRNVTSLIDRAASRGLIHKNAAGRYKSRLAVGMSKPT